MNENEEALKEALAENNRFKAEKAAQLTMQSTAEFSGRMKLTERILMIYLLLCVVFGVPVLNLFILSGDLKTLITCLLVLVVVYETTVLLKLWYVVAGTKLSVLKEVKLLRMEVSQLSLAGGTGENSMMPSEKYEPTKGLSKTERHIWVLAMIVLAIVLGSTSGGGLAWLGANNSLLNSDSTVSLNRDGSAVCTTDIVHERMGLSAAATNIFGQSPSFPFYVPSSCTVNWFDEEGRKMNFKTTEKDNQTRYEVELPSTGARSAYTYIIDRPHAATQSDNLWTYKGGSKFVGKKKRYSTTVMLPEGAEVVSVAPKPMMEFSSGGRQSVRYRGTLEGDENFSFEIKYRLPEQTK